MEKLIKGEEPLRQPPIYVVHIPPNLVKELYTTFIAQLKEFKVRNPKWDYLQINMEKELFKILDELQYTDGAKTALTGTREELKSGLESSVKNDLIRKVETLIDSFSSNYDNFRSPPFVALLNMHACYPYIQTKDIISTIINKSDILIIIFYLDLSLTNAKSQEDEIYRLGNYGVHSIHINTME